jgi:hypothetical protein
VAEAASSSLSSPLEILQAFSTNLALQREAIAAKNWAALAEIVPHLQHAMSLVQSYPGGAASLRADLSELASQGKSQVADLLQGAAADRLAAAELIRININRLNALKALLEHGAMDQSETGQVNLGSPGSLISRRV